MSSPNPWSFDNASPAWLAGEPNDGFYPAESNQENVAALHFPSGKFFESVFDIEMVQLVKS